MELILWFLLAFVIILLISAAATAYRYRQQIRAGWMMWSAFRKMRKQTRPKTKNIEPKSHSKDSPLIRCSKCQKWVPQDGAVKLKSNFFCSHRCLEESFTATKTVG